ncbi:extracellular solute-binding protein [Holophaga foetida]|uniref:extracellular solute-binding protein n=1 Tax=Holophaga foetida TaxID=35839 RepID=UPI00024750A8|nr:extracellular solute-binding protein [Holophaga foetida]
MANRLHRLILLLPMLFAMGTAWAQESITLSSTTSTEQSGLFGFILPRFEARTGIKVKVVAVGTGQALDIGRRGDADVVLVHDRSAEDKFVAEGFGIARRNVMYNDFIVVGPKDDPARVSKAADVVEVMKRIATAQALFVSRGDRSGTHAAELRFWRAAEVTPANLKGYKETGSGMGPTLNMAAAMEAYTLADRGTWLAFKNRQALVPLFMGDKRLFNPYGVMLVNPARHPHVKQAAGMSFIDWIVSAEGQAAIAAYRINGEQLFFPDAGK